MTLIRTPFDKTASFFSNIGIENFAWFAQVKNIKPHLEEKREGVTTFNTFKLSLMAYAPCRPSTHPFFESERILRTIFNLLRIRLYRQGQLAPLYRGKQSPCRLQ